MASGGPEAAEGPFPGSRCVAGPGGQWERATIRRVNEDGTFTIQPDKAPSILMPYVYGVTAEEISFNDEGLWPAALARLTDGADRLTEPTLVARSHCSASRRRTKMCDDSGSRAVMRGRSRPR